MMFRIVLFLLVSNVCLAQVPNTPSVKNLNAVNAVMKEQQDAWNRGDINAFMEGYWKSDQLVFVGGGGPVYGWKQTKDNYHKRYPSKDEMGTLTFTTIEVVQLDKKIIRLIGKYHLERKMGDLSGFFTLIFRKFNDRWLIVSDHTSASP